MAEERRQIRAAAIGVDQIVSVWENMNDGCPYFAVWYNKADKYFQYNGDTLDKARDFLITNLQVIQDQGDNSLYYLKIYPTSEKNYSRSGEICAIPFRLNAYNESSVGGLPAGLDSFAKMFQEANAKHLELVKELAELKAANAPMDWYDRITGILDTPGAANAIVPLLQPVIGSIMGVVNKLTGVQGAPAYTYPTPAINGPAIAGDDLDAKLDLQLDRLSKHGDLVELLTVLADFADKNPGQFRQYFEFLKTQ